MRRHEGAKKVSFVAAGHAFFDRKPDENTKATLARFGVYHAASMRTFFFSTLY